MNLPYPQSIPCFFDGFPPALEIRMGASGGDIVAGASLGSKFTLTRTPKCGVPQGYYVVGSALPEYRMIYSDTGSDDNFTIKVSFIGYGTFYKYTDNDTYLRFQVYKAIAIETAAGEKIFGDTFDCETLIPADSDTTALFSYDGSTVRYADKAQEGEDSGSFWLDGQLYHLSDGSSVTITSASGGKNTYTFVGKTLVIS